MNETLHQHLKDSTRRRHEQAEGHPFQGALAQGALPLESYKQYVCQLTHLHRMFEDMLRQAAGRDENVRSVVVPEHYQLSFLQSDLKALGTSEQANAALPCLQKFTASPMFKQSPVSLLGVLYVLLGSKHGGKFIAHKVKEVYGLGDGGYVYFNPFGENFRALWQSFTGALNALPENDEIRNAALQGADATFEVFIEIGEAIWQAQQPSAVP